jgi:hypothetical protein
MSRSGRECAALSAGPGAVVRRGGRAPRRASVECERCTSRDGSRYGPQKPIPAHVVRVRRPVGASAAAVAPVSGSLQLHRGGRPPPERPSRRPRGSAQNQTSRRRRERRRRGQCRVLPPQLAAGAGGEGRGEEGVLVVQDVQGQQGGKSLALPDVLLEGAGEYKRHFFSIGATFFGQSERVHLDC